MYEVLLKATKVFCFRKNVGVSLIFFVCVRPSVNYILRVIYQFFHCYGKINYKGVYANNTKEKARSY